MNEGRDRVVRRNSMCLSEGDECDDAWEVVDGGRVNIVVGGVRLLFEVPWDEWCVVAVVFTNVL